MENNDTDQIYRPKNNHADPWKDFASRWKKYYTPPGAPSVDAIKFYKKQILKATKNKKFKVLVLGATPALREMLATMNSEVTIIDINIEMILLMTKLVKNKNLKEIVVCGNWIDNPLSDNYYDIVLGDLVLANIPNKLKSKFLKKIFNLLKKDGYWITKIAYINADSAKKSFDKIAEQYSKVKFNRNTAIDFVCYLMNSSWDKKTDLIDLGLIRKWMFKFRDKTGKFKHKNKKIEFLLNTVWEFWFPMTKVWTYSTKEKTNKIISKFFKITNEECLNDCHFEDASKLFRMISCQVKK